jgi:hypothetical protein
MGILRNLFSAKKDGKPEEMIGNVDPVCPHCAFALLKMPGKKTKCPNCKNYIYVRTRPVDGKKVLVTTQQVEALEEQWAIVNGTHQEYLAKKREFEEERSRLSEHSGNAADGRDVKWAIYNKELMKHANGGNFGLYRNIRLEMAEFLRKEGKLEDSLSTYIEILYLDLNGPKNTSGLSTDYFLPHESLIAPGIISRIADLITRLGWTENEVWKELERVGNISHKALKLPLSSENAWKKMKPQIFG